MARLPDTEAVTRFWFDELTPAQWFCKDLELDGEIAARFGELLEALASGIDHRLEVPWRAFL